MPHPFSLDGRVALVTGASRGLGLAMAEALGQAGALVVLSGRNPETLEAAASDLRAKGLKAEAIALDVTDTQAAREAVGQVAAGHGRLDIVLLNAGIQHRSPLLEWELSDFQRLLDTNLTACFVLAQEAARHMIPRGHGRIIFTGSTIGIFARGTIHGYAASKAGLAGLTKSLAVELGANGITCNAICPGFFETDMNTAIVADPDFAARIKGRIPVGRWGQPEDLGGAAVFLASDASAFVNGHLLVVDGGHTIAA